jgi:hypothetical protein
MSHSVLGIIDRAYRGAVEVQFFDAMYGALEFHEQLGRADLALRGLAVTLAVDEHSYVPALKLGTVLLDTLPDYRRSVRDLVAEQLTVYVDEPDLYRLGLTAQDLVPGVVCLDTNELAARWTEYEGIWFL